MDAAIWVAIVSGFALLTNTFFMNRAAQRRESDLRDQNLKSLEAQREADAEARRSAERLETMRIEAERRRIEIDRRFSVLKDFLEEAQRLETAAVARFEEGKLPQGVSNDRIWYLQKLLQTVSSSVFSQREGAAYEIGVDYTMRIDRALWTTPVPWGEDRDVWDYLYRPRQEFLDAAKLLLE